MISKARRLCALNTMKKELERVQKEISETPLGSGRYKKLVKRAKIFHEGIEALKELRGENEQT